MPYGYVRPGNWSSLKLHILRRDEYVCYACGHDGATHVDHLIAVAEGGTHDEGNLAAIHGEPCPMCGRDCHRVKSEAERLRGIARRRDGAKWKRRAEAHPNARSK